MGLKILIRFYIRVDILERLFLKIIEKTKDGIFKIDSDMINLIGCNKENFFELMKLMQYKNKTIKTKTKKIFLFINLSIKKIRK